MNSEIKSTLFFFSLFALLLSCQPQDEILTDTTDESFIRFDPDTVFFDTLFSNFESPSRRLSIKNTNNNAVSLSRVYLEGEENSPYRLIINGENSTEGQDIFLRGDDSIRIFIDILPPVLNTSEIIALQDFLVVEADGKSQKLPLISWVQDGILLNNQILECNEIWTSEKPYIIEGNVLVDENCKLSIEAGTQIFFRPESALLVGGSLEVNGMSTAEVNFSSFRRDGVFKDAFGQWLGIIFGQDSKQNMIRYAKIENAIVGIRFATPDNDTIPDLIIENTIIQNMADVGLFSLSSDVTITNTLINNCLSRTLAIGAGGNYHIKHTTLANFGFDFFREEPSVELSNSLSFLDTLGNEQLITEDLNVRFTNSIIWGSLSDEVLLSENPNAGFNISLKNNIVRTSQESLLNQPFTNLFNQDPIFKDAFESNYQLDSLSPAIDAGMSIGVEIDLEGKAREAIPDLGAYEYQK